MTANRRHSRKKKKRSSVSHAPLETGLRTTCRTRYPATIQTTSDRAILAMSQAVPWFAKDLRVSLLFGISGDD